MTILYNRKSEKQKRRNLRNNATYSEKILWLSLRRRAVDGVRFLRQYSVERFILDFYSPEVRLAIEIDGDSHIGKEEYDKMRQKFIESLFIKVIRFKDEEVRRNPDKVVETIKKIVTERKRELKG